MSWLTRLKELLWTGAPEEHSRIVVVDPGPRPCAPHRPDGLWAAAGEEIVCDGPDQHYIATVQRDIKRGEMQQSPIDIGAWRIEQPALGTGPESVPGCPSCAGKWWRGTYHFKDGWR